MPLSLRRLCSLSLLAVLAGAGATAWAGPLDVPGPGQGKGQEGRGQDRDRQGNDHDRGADHRALSDAVRRAERATRGQVLSAERVQYDGRDVNRVKIVDDRGRVRVYWDDPEAQRQQDAPRTRRDDSHEP